MNLSVSHGSVCYVLCAVFGSFSCHVTQFQQIFNCQTDGGFVLRLFWYTEEFMLHSLPERCQGPVAAEQTQTIIFLPPCLTVGVSCFWWNAAFGFNVVHYNQSPWCHSNNCREQVHQRDSMLDVLKRRSESPDWEGLDMYKGGIVKTSVEGWWGWNCQEGNLEEDQREDLWM